MPLKELLYRIYDEDDASFMVQLDDRQWRQLERSQLCWEWVEGELFIIMNDSALEAYIEH